MTTKINTYTKFSSILLLIFVFLSAFNTKLIASEPQEAPITVGHSHAESAHVEDVNKPIDITAIAKDQG